MGMRRYGPAARHLQNAYDDLLSIHGELTTAASHWNADLANGYHDWASESIDALNQINTEINRHRRQVSELVAAVADLRARYTRAWAAHHDRMQELPQRHAVTRDEQLMEHLSQQARDRDPDDMAQYLYALGLTPKGPAFIHWTIETRGRRVHWVPRVPVAAPCDTEPQAPIPSGAAHAPHRATNTPVPPPQEPDSAADAPLAQTGAGRD